MDVLDFEVDGNDRGSILLQYLNPFWNCNDFSDYLDDEFDEWSYYQPY